MISPELNGGSQVAGVSQPAMVPWLFRFAAEYLNTASTANAFCFVSDGSRGVFGGLLPAEVLYKLQKLWHLE